MSICGLQRLSFGVPLLEEAARFMRDWNLRCVREGADEYGYETEDGARISLSREDSPLLPAPVGERCKLREIVWAVQTPQELERIEQALSGDREVVRDAQGTLHTRDESGVGVAFELSTLRTLAPAEPAVNAPGRPVRRNTPVDFGLRPQVRHLGHVAIFVPELDKAWRFYEQRLGFRPSDVYPGRGVFLRAPGSHDHHNIFLLQRPGQEVGFHHLSFEVPDFHQVMTGGLHMKAQGWKSHFGPGRHTLGSNYFWYFALPFEGSCEYYSDMDYLDDDWETRSWDYSPEVVAAWTTELVTKS